MLETESYLPIIKNLAEKLKEQDAEARILSVLLSKLKFIMLVIDPSGNIIYTNKKDTDYSGIKCWDFLHDREKQCNDCYFNPVGDKSGIGISIKKYDKSEHYPDHITICHPIRDNGNSFMIQLIIELEDTQLKNIIKGNLMNFIKSM